MKKVAIVNYGMGNLDSVARAVEECEGQPLITSDPRDLGQASFIILPGVGNFSSGMKNIRRLGLDQALSEQVLGKGIPFLGICLGMQLLADKGFEGGQTQGLGWIGGQIRQLIPETRQERIPHMGWNEVDFNKDSMLFEGISSGKDFYFVHSYNFVCKDEDDILARTPYCGNFVSAVGKGRVFGVQFHPEKSQRAGFQLLRNFLKC